LFASARLDSTHSLSPVSGDLCLHVGDVLEATQEPAVDATQTRYLAGRDRDRGSDRENKEEEKYKLIPSD
jgi:hypothetical protein